jgi:hypothetical protein
VSSRKPDGRVWHMMGVCNVLLKNNLSPPHHLLGLSPHWPSLADPTFVKTVDETTDSIDSSLLKHILTSTATNK